MASFHLLYARVRDVLQEKVKRIYQIRRRRAVNKGGDARDLLNVLSVINPFLGWCVREVRENRRGKGTLITFGRFYGVNLHERDKEFLLILLFTSLFLLSKIAVMIKASCYKNMYIGTWIKPQGL